MSVAATLYRSLLRLGRQLDREPLGKALLLARATSFFDRSNAQVQTCIDSVYLLLPRCLIGIEIEQYQVHSGCFSQARKSIRKSSKLEHTCEV